MCGPLIFVTHLTTWCRDMVLRPGGSGPMSTVKSLSNVFNPSLTRYHLESIAMNESPNRSCFVVKERWACSSCEKSLGTKVFNEMVPPHLRGVACATHCALKSKIPHLPSSVSSVEERVQKCARDVSKSLMWKHLCFGIATQANQKSTQHVFVPLRTAYHSQTLGRQVQNLAT